MPKRTDIRSIMIIGAGPIVIGQACEFDYSGAQACKALREEGYRVILVNSNPATIMTDPELADATYIEPITPEVVAKIIEKERPDALLPTMGGQTGLNTSLALEEMGVLEKYGVEMIGAKREAIEMAEDRKLFREAMDRIGLENPKATIVSAPKLGTGKYDIKVGLAQAMEALEEIGLPAIIRPAFTLGGTGGGVAYNREEYEHYCRTGMEASPVAQILVDESLLGWKEFEMEVVRDKADNAIIVCSIENVDPMGVHTGDSITVAPALTLTDKEYQMMRGGSIAVLREIGVETGGSNVQWAVNPEDGRMVVIEMNPRVSRSKRAGLQGHGFPHRQDRGEARRGLHAGRARQRHHQGDAGQFRADHRLCGHEDPALRIREVPGLRAHAHHRDEIGGGGHGHRPDLPRVDAEGAGSMETGLTGFDEIDIPGAPEAAAITKALSRQTPTASASSHRPCATG
jgi:carbamoyl-phosphate synthase large subunit